MENPLDIANRKLRELYQKAIDVTVSPPVIVKMPDLDLDEDLRKWKDMMIESKLEMGKLRREAAAMQNIGIGASGQISATESQARAMREMARAQSIAQAAQQQNRKPVQTALSDCVSITCDKGEIIFDRLAMAYNSGKLVDYFMQNFIGTVRAIRMDSRAGESHLSLFIVLVRKGDLIWKASDYDSPELATTLRMLA